MRRWTISRKGNVGTAGCDLVEGRASARPEREESRLSAKANAQGFREHTRLACQSLQKSPRSRGRDRQHAGRVRYPEERETDLQQLFCDGIGYQFSGASKSEAICLEGKQSIADQILCLILINRIGNNSLAGTQTKCDVLGSFHRWS